MLAEGIGAAEASIAEVRAMVPALRPDYAVAAAIEEDAFDMDVAALHQGFLRQLRTHGGVLALRHRAGRIERRSGAWDVHTSGGDVFRAPVVVNAAGAWGDEVAAIAGVAPSGPDAVPAYRRDHRSAAMARAGWPLLQGFGQTGTPARRRARRLMVSLADQTPMHPHDVQPDELDVATAIHRMQQALDIEVRRVERSWAGLRTFTPDHSLAFGWDAKAAGFFWCVGQGGYGIQTSPAAGKLVADLIGRRDPGEAADIVSAIDPGRFASR